MADEKWWMPPMRSGFVEGQCPNCKKRFFSKGRINKSKHVCPKKKETQEAK